MTESTDTTPQTDDPRLPHTVAAEAPARRQIGQRVTCHIGNSPDTAESFDVLVTNRERIHFEKTQVRRKWPTAAEAQNLAMTFVCWSAAQRAGQYPGNYEQWETELLDYDVIEDEPSDPTR